MLQEIACIQDKKMMFCFCYSLDTFVVDDDDDDDLEEDVFCDPGFIPELEELSDDDKENDNCIEIATPGTSYI